MNAEGSRENGHWTRVGILPQCIRKDTKNLTNSAFGEFWKLLNASSLGFLRTRSPNFVVTDHKVAGRNARLLKGIIASRPLLTPYSRL